LLNRSFSTRKGTATISSLSLGNSYYLQEFNTETGSSVNKGRGTVSDGRLIISDISIPPRQALVYILSIDERQERLGKDRNAIVIEAKDYENKSEDIADEGTHLSGIKPWEWATFRTISIAEAGEYLIEYEVASAVGGGLLQLEQAGTTNVFGSIAIPATGAVDIWERVSHVVSFPKGEIVLAIKGIGENWNPWSLRQIIVSRYKEEGANGVIHIEAESYSNKDGNVINAGSYVSDISAWRWLSYANIYIPESGTYLVEYLVASELGGGYLNLEEGGTNNVYGSVNIPATGGFQQWERISHIVVLPEGNLNFGIKGMGSDNTWNLDWFRFSHVEQTNVPIQTEVKIFNLSVYPVPAYSKDLKIKFAVKNPTDVSLSVYDIHGRLIDVIVETKLLHSGTHVYGLPNELKSGIYFVRLAIAGNQEVVRFIVK
jgi:hypothetical protein